MGLLRTGVEQLTKEVLALPHLWAHISFKEGRLAELSALPEHGLSRPGEPPCVAAMAGESQAKAPSGGLRVVTDTLLHFGRSPDTV